MPKTSRHYFVGCPLFGLTIFVTAHGDAPMIPSPTSRFLAIRRTEHGERHIWFGQRLCMMVEPQRLRPASPLLIIV